jgi:hypothetical protein
MRTIAAYAVVCSLGAFSYGSRASAATEGTLDTARQAAFAGDADGCVAQLDLAVRGDLFAKIPDAWVLLGQCQFLQGQPNAAAYAFRRALQLDPDLLLAPEEAFDVMLPSFLATQRRLVSGEVCAAAGELKQMALTLAANGDAQLGAKVMDEARDARPSLRVARRELPDRRSRRIFAARRAPVAYSVESICARNHEVVARETTGSRAAVIVVHANVKGAEVLVDGKHAGRVGDPIRVRPGVSDVAIVHPDYARRSLTLRMQRGQRIKAGVDLAPLDAHH